MSDFELFSGSEQSEGVDAAALEQMREQMKVASAQIKGDQAQEAKQKKQEDVLYQILLLFMAKLGPDHILVRLIVRAFSDGISAEMIVVILSLNYKTLQQLVGLKIISPEEQNDPNADDKKLVIPKLSENDLPLNLKINLDNWIRLINSKAFENPSRILKSIRDEKEQAEAKSSLIDLMSYVAQDYLENEQQQFIGENVLRFVKLLITNLIERLEKHIESRKKLK